MSWPERIDAVLCDVGGPVYTDDNFLWAARRALDEARAARELEPVATGDFMRVYRAAVQSQSTSIRGALAAEFLGAAELKRELSQRIGPYWTHPVGTHFPDALELFRALHGRVRIAVVANQEKSTVDALTRDGFAEYIDVWGISAAVGYEKPSPEFFAWALRECGSSPEHTVHIGNRLDTDVRPARSLGIGAVWVLRGEAPESPTEEQRAEADLVVPDLTSLPDVILERARS